MIFDDVFVADRSNRWDTMIFKYPGAFILEREMPRLSGWKSST